jgi:hypothetical protein
MLFKVWCSSTNIQIVLLNDSTIIDLVAYYYPSVEIQNNKFIHKISSLWKKREDIDLAVESLSRKITENGVCRCRWSVYEAYNHYICSSDELRAIRQPTR